jgi:hypothetical protein
MSDVFARIARYRTAARDTDDLEVAAGIFHETLACDPAFMALGRPHHDRRLRDLVATSLSGALGSEIALLEVGLTRIDRARFVYGAATGMFRGEDFIVAITCFEEDDLGMCVAFNGDTGAIFLRFAAHASDGPAINSPCGIA